MLSQKGNVTYNEILEQPAVWQKTLEHMDAARGELQTWLRTEQFNQFLFVGAGSSFNVCLTASRTLQMITGLTTLAWPASEILFCARPPYDARLKTLLVFVSRCGETTETLWALQRLHQIDPRAAILSITCKAGTPLVSMSQKTIILEHALEESVVATKSMTSCLLAAQVLAGWLLPDDRFVDELRRIPGTVNLEKRKAELQKMTKPVPTHTIMCGHGPFYGVAREAAMKVKQMTMTSSEVMYPLELRHGMWSAVNPGTHLVFFMSETLKVLEDDIVWEVAKLTGPRSAFAEVASPRTKSGTEHVVELNSGLSECARAIPMIALWQLVCFYLAIAKGANPDKPKQTVPIVRIKVGG